MSNIETSLHYPLPLGKLPRNWDVGYVGDFATDIGPGFASGEHNQEGSGIPHLRPMNIDRLGKLDLTIVKYVAPFKHSKRLHVGDVLFNNTNSPELVGKTTAITQEADWAFSNHMTRIVFPREISSKFAAYQLHYLWMSGYFLHKCVKHVNQASVSSDTLKRSVPFVVASPKEQESIVNEIEKQFSRLDEAVANLKRVKANLKRYKASVLKAAVEGKLTEQWRKEHPDVEPASKLLERILAERRAKWEEAEPAKLKTESKASKDKRQSVSNASACSDSSGLPMLPSGWCWVRMEDVGKVQLGRQRAPKYHSGAHMRPYLRVQNVFEDRIDLGDVMEMDFPPSDYEKYRLEPGDILLNEGQSPELLGRPAIYRAELPGACFTNTLIRYQVAPPIQPEFPLLVFRNYMRSGRFTREGTITTNIAHLSAGRFAKIEFPLPPLKEQAEIIKEAERHLSVIDTLEREVDANLRRAERLRQSILRQAFSGRLTQTNSD